MYTISRYRKMTFNFRIEARYHWKRIKEYDIIGVGTWKRPRGRRKYKNGCAHFRLVEGSNCMHNACQTLLLLMDIGRTSRSSLRLLNKKPSYISAAVFLSTVWHCRHDCNVYLLHQAHACRSICSSAQKQPEKKYVLYVYSFIFWHT